MKKCTRCKQEKKISEFNFKFKSKNVRQAQCHLCTRLYVREHYYKNKDYYLTKASKRNTEKRILIRKYLWSYLNQHPCLDCGESDPLVLEFDHKEDKIMPVSKLVHNNSLEQVKREILKCDVRCANCHRRKTALQFDWHKNIMPL